MNIDDTLKCPRTMGFMAYVNRAADDPDGRAFRVSVWLRSGMKWEGLPVNVPKGGYTQKDMILEGAGNEYSQTCILWDDINLLTVNWK
jgi:hypothetical protein